MKRFAALATLSLALLPSFAYAQETDLEKALLQLNRVSLVTTRPVSFSHGSIQVGTESNIGLTVDLLRYQNKAKSPLQLSFGLLIPAENRSANRFSMNPQANVLFGQAVLGAGFDIQKNSGLVFIGYRLK